MIPNYTPGGIGSRGLQKTLWLIIVFVLFTIFSFAQSTINYVEYYIDQDPGLKKATPVNITPTATVTNASFSITVNTLTNGIHMLGARAQTATGVWSMTHFWFIFKPYAQINTPGLTNISRVEYYVDEDPGFGKGTAVTITPGQDLQNISFTINPSTLGKGTHIIGGRALSANGQWSETNYWLFYNPFENISQPQIANINYVEYFINKDPGIGKAIPLTTVASADIVDQSFSVAIDTLKTGTSILGIRAKNAGGNWSMTNYWLFVKPFAATPAPAAAGNITAVEYYLDYDPGKGNGIPVPVSGTTDLSNISFNTDITNIVPGDHYVTARALDTKGNWSFVNTIKFNIPGTAPVLNSTYAGNAQVCAGAAVSVGYAISGVTFNSANKFIAQLSDASGSFASPSDIGSVTSTALTGTITAVIPALTSQGFGYRLRVISTNQSIVGTNNGSNITVNPVPAMPSITAAGSTSICSGTGVVLTSSANSGNQWYVNGSAINNAIAKTYTALSAGNYTVVSTVNTCVSATSTITTVTIGGGSAAPVISAAGALGFCAGGSVILNSSSTTGNQWFLNGIAISNATGSSYTVTVTGNYTATNATGGCTSAASNVLTVTVNAIPAAPVITAAGSVTVCSGTGVVLSSSAATGNQWYRNGTIITGEVNKTYTASVAGNYTVIATIGTCSSIASNGITVTLATPAGTPTVTAGGPLSFCTGGSVVLTSGIASGNQWLLNGQVIANATATSHTATSTGAYTVVNNTGGCTGAPSAAITVTVNAIPAAPSITAAGSTTVCSGTSVVLSSSAASGNQWYFNGTPIPGETNKTYAASAAGNYTVVATAGVCASAASLPIAIAAGPAAVAPVITANGPTSFCTGGSVVLSSSISGGNQWLLNGLAIPNATANSLTVTATGNYSVTNTSNGCSSTSSSAITVSAGGTNNIPVITASGSLTVCAGTPVLLSSSEATGNQWLLNGVLISGATSKTFTATTSGNYTVAVTTGSCGSSTSSATVVTVNPVPATPVINATGAVTQFCAGKTVVLNSSAASGNQWLLNGVNINSASGNTYTASLSGNYTVITTINGCSSVASNPITLTVNPLPPVPTVTAAGPTSFCSGLSVVLSSSAATGNQWFKDTVAINGATNQAYTANASGNYTVKTTNASGCLSESAGTKVTVNALPAKPVIKLSGSDLVSSSANGNQWYRDTATLSGATNAVYKPTLSAYYKVQVTENGCTSPMSDAFYYLVSAVSNINANSPGTYTLVPNPVSDRLYIQSATISDKITIQLIDANGRVLFNRDFKGKTEILLRTYPQGMYTVLLTNTVTKKQESKQIIKL